MGKFIQASQQLLYFYHSLQLIIYVDIFKTRKIEPLPFKGACHPHFKKQVGNDLISQF